MKEAKILRSVALFFVFGITIPLLLFSCSSVKSTENNAIYHDSASTHLRKDSVNTRASVRNDTYAHDSVFRWDSIQVLIKGDTVIRDRWHHLTITKTKTVQVHDTIIGDTYHLVSDTVKVKYYVNRYKYKEKPLTWWERQKLECCGFFMGAFVVVTMLFINERRLRMNEEEKREKES